MTFDEAKEVLAELARWKVDYVLIGSMAMAAQGLPRATRDMDFFVDPKPEKEYVPPHGRYSMDILTRLGEAFGFEDIESEVIQIDDFTLRVATPRMLYRMKRDTVRPQDRADAARLRDSFGLDEE